ncbi:MAG: hemerythrin domain-containing protein [Bryobacterales bacterium]|nr:hemerythrin domain-containing protein [Bryobacterales bacterium]
MLRDPSLIPLSHQHHNGLALCVLIDRALRDDGSAESVAMQARRAVERYEIELANHFELEEQLLFPAVVGYLGSDPAVSVLIAALIAEHRRFERIVETLRAGPTAAALTELSSLLRAHIRREERELFEDTQRRLPRETLDWLGAQFEARAVRVCLQPLRTGG